LALGKDPYDLYLSPFLTVSL